MTDTAEGGVAAPSDAAAVSTGSEGTSLAAASGVEAAGAPSPQVPDTCAPEGLTPEELAEVHAHNAWVRALDAALTDIRQRSYEGKLTTMARWRKRSVAPEGMSAQEFEQKFAAYLDEHEHAEAKPVMGRLAAPKPLAVELEGREVPEDEPLTEPSVVDIALMQGKKATYLYSAALLSHSFAMALYHTAEDNDVATFVDVVRTESSTYPRPVGIDSFMNPPYLWAPARTREVYQKTIATSSFKDIHETQASNGRTYYYSDMYLSEAQARSLAEWYGVEQQRNP